MDKVSIGIKQLDDLIGCGVNHGSSLLFTGMPGTGKSLFIHKIVYSYLERGYTVVFVTTDRHPDQLIDEVKNLGMNYKKYIKKDKLIMIDVYSTTAAVHDSRLSADIRDLTSVSLLIDQVTKKLDNSKMVHVFDVLSELFVWTSNNQTILQFISSLCGRTRSNGGISYLVVNEGMQKQEYLNTIKALTDGVINLGFDNDKRWLKVEKMKGVPVSTRKNYFRINRKDGKISFLRKK